MHSFFSFFFCCGAILCPLQELLLRNVSVYHNPPTVRWKIWWVANDRQSRMGVSIDLRACIMSVVNGCNQIWTINIPSNYPEGPQEDGHIHTYMDTLDVHIKKSSLGITDALHYYRRLQKLSVSVTSLLCLCRGKNLYAPINGTCRKAECLILNKKYWYRAQS